jgi:hypothetical protein
VDRHATGQQPGAEEARHRIGAVQQFRDARQGGQRKRVRRYERQVLLARHDQVPPGRPRFDHDDPSITIRHAGAGGEFAGWDTQDFDLLVSNDGTNFTTVATVRNNTADVRTNTLSTSGRFVRLNILQAEQGSGSGGAARIYELELYG